MISHYLKTSVRSMVRRPLLSTLNIMGLSVGLACFLVIAMYLYQENTYEKGFSNYESIYRLEEDFLGMGRTAWSTSNLQYKLDEIPGVESYVRLTLIIDKENAVEIGDKKIKSPLLLNASEGMFDVFDFDLAVTRKRAIGGTAPEAVKQQIEAAKVLIALDEVDE